MITGTCDTPRIIRRHVAAVDIGKPEIEHDHIRIVVDRALQTRHTRRLGPHDVPSTRQSSNGQVPNLEVVFNNHYRCHELNLNDAAAAGVLSAHH